MYLSEHLRQGKKSVTTRSIQDLVVQPMFGHVVKLPICTLKYEGPVSKPKDDLVIVRDVAIMALVRELKHILMDTAVPMKGYHGNYLDMPIIDMHAMLEFLSSYLDKLVSGSASSARIIENYITMEILDHDAETTPLLRGVMDTVQDLFTRLTLFLLDHSFDHYAPHRYELQEVLPAGGLVLRRSAG